MGQRERDKAVAEAIEFIEKCPLKGRFVKIELEANLERGDEDDYYEAETCQDCRGSGSSVCSNCNGGEVPVDSIGVTYETCDECHGEGYIECSYCDGEGAVEGSDRSWSDSACQDFIRRNVSPECRNAIVFNTFYYDGSVDSEYSVTIPLDKPQFAVELITAFKELSDHIGNGIDTHGAGMHIAILSDPKGNYVGSNKIDTDCWNNFKQSVNHLMPALFFLASADHRSRGFSYRFPEVSNNKGSAISLRGSVIEWRVFETCYNRPEMFYDYLCTIANTLKFYTKKPTVLPFFGKLGRLGFPDGQGVHRFFYSHEHLTALERGLEVLRPAFRTKEECYKLRNFTASKEAMKARAMRKIMQAESEWKVVKKSRKERLAIVKEQAKARALRHIDNPWNNYDTEEVKTQFIEHCVENAVHAFNLENPSNKVAYIKQKLTPPNASTTVLA